jgi:DNA-directed RNA polymerase alpha subunit
MQVFENMETEATARLYEIRYKVVFTEWFFCYILQSQEASKIHRNITQWKGRDMNVNELPLSVRAGNALSNANIHTIAELLNYDWMKLSSQRNAGAKTIAELAQQLINICKQDVLVHSKNYDWEFAKWQRTDMKKKYHKMKRQLNNIQLILNNSL